MGETVTQTLGEYCAALSLVDVDPETIEYAKQLVLDTLGTAVGGYVWSDSAEITVDTARALHAKESAVGQATVLGTSDRLSPGGAALANGALSHSLDYDNRHSAGSLHIGSSVISAALAAGEVAEVDGEQFLEAVIAGYDIAARLGMACHPRSSHQRGFHPTGTCGTFGATAAVGVINGFSTEEFVTAFGINGSQASGGYQCSRTGGWNKRIHPGLAARDAFTSVAFTANGFEGPTAPIAGELGFLQAYANDPRPARATEALGERFEAAHTKIKPYPIGTFAHVPISLLIDLATEQELVPATIEGIDIELPTSGAEMFGREPTHTHPTGSNEAQFDMPFAVALAVTERQVDIRTFNEAVNGSYNNEFTQIMNATETIGSDELESYLPELYPARVRVQTSDATYERFREWVSGEPTHPLSWGELTNKFTTLTPSLEEDTQRTVIEQVKTIEAQALSDVLASFRSTDI